MKTCVPKCLKKLIWIYGVEQPELFETIKEIWAPRQCEFIEGFPEDLMSRLEKQMIVEVYAFLMM